MNSHRCTPKCLQLVDLLLPAHHIDGPDALVPGVLDELQPQKRTASDAAGRWTEHMASTTPKLVPGITRTACAQRAVQQSSSAHLAAQARGCGRLQQPFALQRITQMCMLM